jgi:predicted neutral ceramidase superfamily lipid hydrolase
MRRPIIYLAIFTTFFWTNWATLAYLTSPTTAQGQTNPPIISLFLILFFASVASLTTLIAVCIKTIQPNQKLPPLLIKDSLTQGLLIGTWATGLLMLQLLRSASIVNLTLWIIILVSTEWFLRRYHRGTSHNS